MSIPVIYTPLLIVYRTAGIDNPWLIAGEILLAACIFAFLYFRRRSSTSGGSEGGVLRLEMKLAGELTPSVITVQVNRPVRLLIHRFEEEPSEELLEIEELNLYELLPAYHTTIISFLPEKRGTFDIVLAGERRAGRLIVE